MATTSEIEVGLDEIAQIISEQRAVLKKAQSNATVAKTVLGELPTKYADLIATVGAFGQGNTWEENVKAKFDKLAAEFIALDGSANAMIAVVV